MGRQDQTGVFCSFGKYGPRSSRVLGTGLSQTQTGKTSALLGLPFIGGWGGELSCNTAQLGPQSSCQARPRPGQGSQWAREERVPGHCGWMLAQVAPGSLSR